MGKAVAMVTNKVIADYHAQGAVLLKGIFNDWVDALRVGIEKAIANPSEREKSYEKTAERAGFYNDFCNWQRFAELRDFIENSPAAEAAARLMQSQTARIFHDHILVKEPGATTVTPWHQDQPFYPVEGEQSVSFWTPLDAVDRPRCVEFVKGSHRWGKSYKPQRFNGQDLFENDPHEALPDIHSLPDLALLGWTLEPGDAIAFHFRTIHSAPANPSKTRRRVISTRWVGDDATFAVRLGKTSPHFPHLHYQHGDPFDAPEFPIIFKA